MTEAALIDDLIRRRATFAVFRTPGRSTLAYVQRRPVLTPPHEGEDCFVLAPFETAIGPLCIRPDRIIDFAHETSRSDIPPGLSPGAPDAEPEPGLDRPAFLKAVASAIVMVREGKLQKVVLSRTISTDLQGTSIGALFAAAVRSFPHAFVAMARTGPFGLWLGASPERLLALHVGRLEVDAIAATLPLQHAPEHPSDWGTKEREEQAIVTRSVMSLLSSAGVHDPHAHGPQVKVAGNVAHLHTRITANGVGPYTLSLAKALHPTPAVGGHPRQEAIELIRLLEPRPRSLYAGYWGPMGEHGADLFVNIRCMQIHGTRALIRVGAGITSDSDPQREGDEVEQKARLWLDLIQAQHLAG